MSTRYSSGLLTGVPGSTALPFCALVGASTIRPHVYEIGIFNTAAVAVAVKLVRLSTAGTPGTSVTVYAQYTPEDTPAVALLKGTYTSAGPTMTDAGYRCVLGAVVGAGVIWTFGDTGLIVPATTAAGVGLALENGAGQAIQTYWVWSE